MSMNNGSYFEVSFSPVPEDYLDILIAELVETGFDSFNEEENTLLAYISEEFFDETAIQKIIQKYPELKEAFRSITRMPDKNWNELWESRYEPVLIADKCYIRTPFHPPYPSPNPSPSREGSKSPLGDLGVSSRIQDPGSSFFEIIIEPKMSFGTAHHETTVLMIEWLLEEDVSGKMVLDMGCGTGVLAILAFQMGAAEVFAIDHDQWAFENVSENVLKNSAGEIQVIHGDINDIPEKPVDLILANINRNVLLDQIPVYANALKDGGTLLMSGFYSQDLPVIREKAEAQHLRFVDAREKNNWMVVKFNR